MPRFVFFLLTLGLLAAQSHTGSAILEAVLSSDSVDSGESRPVGGTWTLTARQPPRRKPLTEAGRWTGRLKLFPFPQSDSGCPSHGTRHATIRPSVSGSERYVDAG